MSNKVKKFAIYPMLSSGHTNLCITISKILLNNYDGQVEIIWIVDKEWKDKLSKHDSRFKFETFEHENAFDEIVKDFEPMTKLPVLERNIAIWSSFQSTIFKTLETDKKVGDILLSIKPDLILMDQGVLLPSIIRSGCPYAFIVSANPLFMNLSPEFPVIGSDAGINEKEKISDFRKGMQACLDDMLKKYRDSYDQMGVQLVDNEPIDRPLSKKHFNIYCFPREIDYYSDELKKKHKLVSFDCPLIPERIPPPYKLPEEFAKKQSECLIYVSLGSLFSMYTNLIQRLIDALATLPYKFIVSKGPKGDQIKFPNENFIGENYVDQLGVLQIVDLALVHGGNNTLGECFYFGIPCVILPVFADQINNGKRLEETGYGYQLDINNFTDDQLKEVIKKLLNDQEIKSKWKKASERIQKEKNYEQAVSFVFNYV